jgi:hypothetical protein
MDFFTQLIPFLTLPLVLYFVITALLKFCRPKHLYVCPLDSLPSTYSSLLPTDFYTKSQQSGNNDGGYVYASDPAIILQQQ